MKEGEDHKEAREHIAKVWCHIHRKSRKDLGPWGDVSLEPYLQWVQERAIQLKIPYSREAPCDTVAELTVFTGLHFAFFVCKMSQ